VRREFRKDLVKKGNVEREGGRSADRRDLAGLHRQDYTEPAPL